VTDRLVRSFVSELERLQFKHLEIEFQAAGGERGVLFHELVLKRAPGVELPKVLSEGESGTLSLAAFFAELSTEANPSAIIFDDPVSSLDHVWREGVAKRLVEEARERQVIVFTHDIVFMHALSRLAEEMGVHCQHQYLRREAAGTGVSSPELPWHAMKDRERLGA
jgi:energy-coupling factor transporter ATP-binding protein EcfA2